MSEKINQYVLYLFYILPITILSGPFFSDLTIIVIDIWFIQKILLKKISLEKYIDKKIFYFFILFNLYLIISSIISDYKLFSLKSSLFYFRFYFFAFAAVYIFLTIENSKKYFFFSISVSIGLIIMSAFYDLIFIKDFYKNVNIHLGQTYRISGLFGDEWIMGNMLKNYFILFTFFYLNLKFYKKKYLDTKIFLLIFLSITLVIILSGERVATFIFSIFSIFLFLNFRDKFNLFKVFSITLIFVIFTLLVFEKPRERLINSTVDQIFNKELEKEQITFNKLEEFENFNVDDFKYLSIHHDAHARTAIKMFIQSPFFGHGPNNFRNSCKKFEYNEFSCSTHPHNILLQIISETGIIGLLFYILAICFLIFILKIKSKDYKILIRVITVYFLIYFIPFLPSGNFFNNYININFYLILSLLFYLRRKILNE